MNQNPFKRLLIAAIFAPLSIWGQTYTTIHWQQMKPTQQLSFSADYHFEITQTAIVVDNVAYNFVKPPKIATTTQIFECVDGHFFTFRFTAEGAFYEVEWTKSDRVMWRFYNYTPEIFPNDKR